jgi:hypothetical protein
MFCFVIEEHFHFIFFLPQQHTTANQNEGEHNDHSSPSIKIIHLVFKGEISFFLIQTKSFSLQRFLGFLTKLWNEL